MLAVCCSRPRSTTARLAALFFQVGVDRDRVLLRMPATWAAIQVGGDTPACAATAAACAGRLHAAKIGMVGLRCRGAFGRALLSHRKRLLAMQAGKQLEAEGIACHLVLVYRWGRREAGRPCWGWWHVLLWL